MTKNIPLKNSKKSIVVDDYVYDWLSKNPMLTKLRFLDNLREHSSGSVVFQKWQSKTESGKVKIETIYVHKLIAEHFCEKETQRHRYAIHINQNRLDCRVDNLAFSTRGDLNKNAEFNALARARLIRKEGHAWKVTMVDLNNNDEKTDLGVYDTYDEAIEAFNNRAVELGWISRDKLELKKEPTLRSHEKVSLRGERSGEVMILRRRKRAPNKQEHYTKRKKDDSAS